MAFDLAAISSSFSLVQSGLDLATKYGPAVSDTVRRATRDAFATIRASHITNGERYLYPRLVGAVTWGMVAISDTSLLNLSDEVADIEEFEAVVEGGGRAVFWSPGVELSPPPPEAGIWNADGLFLGGKTSMVQVFNRIFATREGFPLVIAPQSERRVQLAFLVDRLVQKDEGVTLRLRCRQRGRRLFRPIAGPLRFDAANPGNSTRVEYDPITRYPVWINNAGGSSSRTI